MDLVRDPQAKKAEEKASQAVGVIGRPARRRQAAGHAKAEQPRGQPAGEHAEELEDVHRLAGGAVARPEVLPPRAERLEEEVVRVEVPGPRGEVAAVAEPVVRDEADRDGEQDYNGDDEPEQGIEAVRRRGSLGLRARPCNRENVLFLLFLENPLQLGNSLKVFGSPSGSLGLNQSPKAQNIAGKPEDLNGIRVRQQVVVGSSAGDLTEEIKIAGGRR